jgi:hypothetical protein
MFFGYMLFLRDVWDERTRTAGLLLTPVPAMESCCRHWRAGSLDRRGERTPMMFGATLFAAGSVGCSSWPVTSRSLRVAPRDGDARRRRRIAWPMIFASVVVGIPTDRYAAATGFNQTVPRGGSRRGRAHRGARRIRRGRRCRSVPAAVHSPLCGLLSVVVGARLRSLGAEPIDATASRASRV